MGKQQSRQAKTLYAGAGNPVMAVVRVKAPAETDPHVLEAALGLVERLYEAFQEA